MGHLILLLIAASANIEYDRIDAIERFSYVEGVILMKNSKRTASGKRIVLLPRILKIISLV